jgi:dUTP pyrophosphatase
MKEINLTDNNGTIIRIFSKFDTEIYKSFPTDAGYDICSPVSITIEPYSNVVINTGLSIEYTFINDKKDFLYYSQIKGRSGLSINKSIEVCNAGVIDQEYNGNIFVKLYNLSDKEYRIKENDRIAQLIFFRIPYLNYQNGIKIINSNGKRNSNGIGSSGK